ncbi:hypothetical protein ACSSVV_001527 [Marinobacter sp. MBR-105]|jgi:hypothetical protein
MANRVCIVVDAKDASNQGLQVAYSSKTPMTPGIKSARFFGTTPQQLGQELGISRETPAKQASLLSDIYTSAMHIAAKLTPFQTNSVCAENVVRLDSFQSSSVNTPAPCPLTCGLNSTRYLKLDSLNPGETIVTFQVDRNDWFQQILNTGIPQGRVISLDAAVMHGDVQERWEWVQGLGVPFSVKGNARLKQGSLNEWGRGCQRFSHHECKLLASAGDHLDIKELQMADSIWMRPQWATPTYSSLSVAWGVALEAIYGMATACPRSGQWSINVGLVGALKAANLLRERGCKLIGAGHGKVHIGTPSPNEMPAIIVCEGITWRRVGANHHDTLLQKKIGEQDYMAILSADQMVVTELNS